MSLWKAQAVWDVKDFNLWRRVYMTEPQKTPQEAWRSFCCFRCDMGWGIWYLSVVMPHTAHMQLQAKKTEFWWKCKKIPRRYNNMLRFFLCFLWFRCLCFTEQRQFSERHSTDLSPSFSTFALINIHEVILEPALLCSDGWLCGYRCVIDQQITGKARGLDEYSEAVSALPNQHWLRLTWSCSAGKDECML